VFANPAGLESVGDNMLMETPASGAPVVGAPLNAGFASILQGSLETSNVNVVSEITNLITAQRAYEMNSKVIRTTDEMLNAMTQLR
jgi:flagellar basal-body rod protein FlgG